MNENEDNHIFGFQDSLKKMFPDKNKFLKMPKLKADQKRLEDFMGLKYEDGKAHDQKFAEFLDIYDVTKMEDALFKSIDQKNMDDPSRSKLKDIEKQMELLKEKAIKSGTNQILRKDIQKVVM